MDRTGQQLINAWFPAELAAALLTRANLAGLSRAELLRRLAVSYLNGDTDA